MLQASDHERRLIAYEIHDGLAQQIAGALMQLDTYQYIKQSAPEEAAAAYQAGVTMLRQSHAEVRRLISGVRPPILDESGVVAAIAHLVHADPFVAGPQIEFRSRVNFTRLAPVVENSIYRIVQEGLTNAWKHSQSDQVRISLVEHGDKIRIGIRDRGARLRSQGCRGRPLRAGRHPRAGTALGRKVEHPQHAGQRDADRRRTAPGAETVTGARRHESRSEYS